jgi:hypothetical protein
MLATPLYRRKRPIHDLFAGLLMAAMLFACSSGSVEKQAAKLGTKEFTAQEWAVAGQESRGEMLASLLAKHRFAGTPAKDVKALLGPPTAYYDYDENPAYLVGPRSVKSPYGDGYLLVFLTDKNKGLVTEVRILP